MNENEKVMLIECDQRSKSNTHQLNRIENEMKEIKSDNKLMYSLVEAVKTISEGFTDMKTDIKEIKNSQNELKNNQNELTVKISEVESKPAKKTLETVEKIKTSAYTAIVTFIVMGAIGALIFFK